MPMRIDGVDYSDVLIHCKNDVGVELTMIYVLTFIFFRERINSNRNSDFCQKGNIWATWDNEMSIFDLAEFT